MMSEYTSIDTSRYESPAVASPVDENGWRQTQNAEFSDPRGRSRVRRRILTVVVAALALAAIVGTPVWIAQTHYDRGRRAMNVGAYDVAVDELAQARVLVFPYRDAGSLESQAASALRKQKETTETQQAAGVRTLALLQHADDRLSAGDAQGVVGAVGEASASMPGVPLTQEPRARVPATTLEGRLLVAARAKFVTAHWHEAGLYATALLLLDPGDAKGAALAKRARGNEILQGRLAAASTAARAHRWRPALSLALAVLHARPGFPGAADLVRRARVALRPKAKPRPAAVTTASTAGRVAPTTPSAPQPPPP
jgi:hypothetical protein